MAETPVSEAKEAAPTPPPETTPLTKFRAVIQGSSKRGNNNAVFTTADLRSLVEVAAALSDKITFFVNEGIKVRVLDGAKIALLDAALPKTVFADFEAHGVGYVTVDARSLLAVLRRAKSKSVEVRFEDGQLTVAIGGVRSFRIRTIDGAGEEVPPEPKTAHAAFAVVDAGLLKELLIDARVMKADVARFEASNGTLMFKAINETKGVEAKLGPAEGEAASTYTLVYLMKAAKAFNGVVEVKFGNNTPLELATAFNEGYVKVFIAPRVE
jgi:DNA polymerase III sliding clamp (beta) subunit (PCNA family)